MFFFQAEDGIRDLVRSRGLGDVYKRQLEGRVDDPGADGVDTDSALEILQRCSLGQPHDGMFAGDVDGQIREADVSAHGGVVDDRSATGLEHRLDLVLHGQENACLLYTSDAADERSSVDLGGRRIIKKKTKIRER